MSAFSRDCDILKYEPVVFGDLHFSWQILCEGTEGQLSGSTFTKTGEDFESAGVSSGGVIYLRTSAGELDGAYEIVSVDSATQLTVSVLRVDESNPAVGPGDATDISYRITTFAPQASEVLFELTQYFGIQPGNPNSDYDVEDILDTSVLRQASVYAILAGIYGTLGSSEDDNEHFWQKSMHYQRLFEKARERCRLSIDIDGDGVNYRTNVGGSIRLLRD